MPAPVNPTKPETPADGQREPKPPNPWGIRWIGFAMVGILTLAGFGGCIAVVSKSFDAAADSFTSAPPTIPAAPSVPRTGAPLTTSAPTKAGTDIVYELISDGPLLSVTYFDENSELLKLADVQAPWAMSFTNASTVALAGLAAQTSGRSVTCRIIQNAVVVAEQAATGKFAAVNCAAAPTTR